MSIGFGIIGSGMIAPFHARAINDSKGGRLIGFHNRNLKSARTMAKDFGVRSFDRLEGMLDDPEVAAVCITTPNDAHLEAVLSAAEAGKHILVEKPPALRLSETDRMIEACASANVLFGCTVQCRVRPAIIAVRDAMRKGRFGKVLHADTYMKWYRSGDYYQSKPWREKRSSGGGVTIQHAFHYIDLLHYLTGPVTAVQARMTNLNHPEVELEDTLSAFVDYANGARGIVQASTSLWPGTDVRIEINGENGTAIVSGEAIQVWQFRDPLPEDDEIRCIGDPTVATAASSAAGFGHRDHGILVQNLIDAINGQTDLAIPVADVRHTLEICLAMYESDRKGTTINLPFSGDSIDVV